MSPREYFELLVFTALIDGQLHQAEVPHLRGFAERLKLSTEETRAVLDAVQGGKRPALKLPAAPKEKATLFRHMARIAVADHRLAPEEMDLLVRVGHELGMSRAKVYDAVDQAMEEAGGEPVLAGARPSSGTPLAPGAPLPQLVPLAAAPAPPPKAKPAAAPAQTLDLAPESADAEEEEEAEEPGDAPGKGAERPAAKKKKRPAPGPAVPPPPVDALARTDHAVLADLARSMGVVAVILWLIPGALVGLGAFAGLLFALKGGGAFGLVGALAQAANAAVLLVVGWNTWAAAGKFGQAAQARSAQDPVRRLMAGISHLHTVYRIQMVLAVLMVLLFLAAVFLLMRGAGAMLR